MDGELGTESFDARFDQLVLGNAWVERLWTGARWLEGPVYFPDRDELLFSDIPNDRIMRWVPDGASGGVTTVFRSPSNHANGNTRDRQGRLVTCEHSGRRVSRTELDGSVTTIADRYDGRRLNSPNDVVVHTDGSIWFTDPSYGIIGDYEGRRAPQEQDGCYVFRWDPEREDLQVVADDLVKPNGLAFSADGSTLYISDTARTHDPDGAHHIVAYDVIGERDLRRREVVAEVEPGIADGFRLDEHGNLWTSAGDGVQCFTPDGTLLGKIRLPEIVSNVVFGGRCRNRLFITASTSVYALYLGVAGIEVP